MAYAFGSVNTMNDLLDGMRTACVQNGWTLSGEVLHKGSSYVRLRVEGAALSVLPGRGIDNANVLTGANEQKGYINAISGVTLTWPMLYEVFIFDNPDEVYCVVNYGVDCYLWLAWGVSPVGGSISGAWAGGSATANTTDLFPAPVAGTTIGTVQAGYSPGGSYRTAAGLFWQNYQGERGGYSNTYIDVGGTWIGADAVSPIDTLITRQPNTWNGESCLIPIQPYHLAASNKVAAVADLANARYVRITNYQPGQIIPLGSDRWKVFPFFRKNASSPDQSSDAKDTGTYGWAIRYDGT